MSGIHSQNEFLIKDDLKNLIHKGFCILFQLTETALFFCLFILLFVNKVYTEDIREEAIFGFKYSGYSTDFSVFIDKDSVFVPLEEVLSFFKIYYTVDLNGRFDGYVNNSDSSFVIDFQTKEIRDISKSNYKIDDKTWFLENLQIYVRTDLIAKIFKLELITYFNKLTINVRSNYQLPLLRSIQVEKNSNNFNKLSGEEKIGPLICSNSFTILNGGILDYSFGANKSEQMQNYNFTGNIGLELFSGEFQYNITGYGSSKSLNLNDNYRWRYLFNNDIINYLSLGNLQNSSVRNSGGRGYRKPFLNLNGIQITNETTKMPNVFTHYIIEDVIEPDWNVELYIADQLYESKRADITGYYRFEIPVSYGLTNIKVKYYGPRGEYITSEKVLNIPSELLSPGEIKYTVSAGEDIISKKKAVDGTVYLGITRWLTSSVSGTKIENQQDYTLINQTSLNLLDNLMFNFSFTNTGVYDAGLKLPLGKNGTLDISYTVFDPSFKSSVYYNTLNIMGSFNNVFSLPFSLSIMGTRNEGKISNSNFLVTGINFYINTINISFRHSMYFNDYAGSLFGLNQLLGISTSYLINEMPDFISFLGRININATTGLNPDDGKFTAFSTGVQFELSRDISINSSFNFNPSYNNYDFKLGISLNLAAFRSTSSTFLNSGNSLSTSSDISGSLEYDSQNKKFSFLNTMGSSGIYGKSSASIKFYEDKNFNNKLDENDELITEADFNITNETATKINSNGYKILNGLVPGTVYNIKVNTGTFPNPSLLPDITEFSFIAEPYSYKSIEIPCHVGGVIEGVISRIKDSLSSGQGGIKVHIDGKANNFRKEVSVFSDGTYFFSGLPIGEYKIYVDSIQVKILNCISKPPVIDFVIKKTAEGDYLNDLNFQLLDNDSITAIKKETALKIAKKSVEIAAQKEMKTTASISNGLKKTESKIIPENASKILKIKSKDSLQTDSSLIVYYPDTSQVPSISDPIAPGRLRTMYYASSRQTFLGPLMKKYIDRIAEYMTANPNSILNIEGHSDSFGTLEENYSVSDKRANEVVNYLALKGIKMNRLIATGYGALRPVKDNKTQTGRAKNMRVELNLISK